MAFNRLHAGLCPLLAVLIGTTIACARAGDAEAQITPQTVQLINRLCTQNLRTNEEDRLYGMISLAVRATIRYRGAEFRPDVIDDAVQDALDAMIEDCPELTAEDESKRVTMAVEMISDATTKVLEDFKKAQQSPETDSPYPRTPPDKLTAADLSEELSSQEIDQWLNSMPPRQRALSLFLYASDVTHREIAEAVGESPGTLSRLFAASKSDLMRIFRQEGGSAAPSGGGVAPSGSDGPSGSGGPAMQFTMSGSGMSGGGQAFAALMRAGAPPAPASAPPTGASPTAASPTAETPAAAAPTQAGTPAQTGTPENDPPPAPAAVTGPTIGTDGLVPSLRVTGISNDLYAGWSLLATGRNLPRGQRISIAEPLILEPNSPGIKRMVVVDVAEIGDPRAATRRFLLKAYAIDGEKEAAGLRESFHVGGALSNEEAKKTLANVSLSSIEVARCLWHDFGTADDPGLCR